MALHSGGQAARLRETETVGAAGDTPALARMLRLRWLIWSVLGLAYIIAYFHRVAPAVVADRLMADFAVGGAVVGGLSAMYFYVYAVMQIPSGALADTIGARYTVAAGTALAGAGSLLFGIAPGVALAYVGRFLVGLGVSVIFIATLKIQAEWFRTREFGTMSGLLMVVGNLGAILATTPLAILTQGVGWRFSFVAIAAATVVIAFVAWRGIRDRPRDLGLPSPRDLELIEEGAAIVPSGPPTKLPFWTGALIVWRNRYTWTAFLAHFGLFGSYLTFTGLWGVPYLLNVYGLDRYAAANYMVAAALGVLISSPLIGYLSDRVLRRRKLPLVLGTALYAALWLLLTFWNGARPPLWSLYPLFALMGFFAGVVTLCFACAKEVNPPSLSGLAMGTANGAFLCAALLQPLVGALLDSRWQGTIVAGARVYPQSGYQFAFAVITAVALLGLLGSLFVKETYCRNLV